MAGSFRAPPFYIARQRDALHVRSCSAACRVLHGTGSQNRYISAMNVPKPDSPTESKLPHVVLILCDQLRYDALGFTGNNLVQTPNLDRLASRGVVFDNHFVQTPVCMGSRACLLTGRYLRTIRMGGGCPLLDPRETTLAETLQHNGYRTGMFGKLHLTPQQYTMEHLGTDCPVNDATPFLEPAGIPPIPEDPYKVNYGFTDCVGFEDGLWGEWRQWLKNRDTSLYKRATANEQRAGDLWASEFPDTPLSDVGILNIPVEHHPSKFITDSASDFFQQHHASQPCFMHVSFVDPHHPFNPPPELASRYDIDAIPLPTYADTGGLAFPDCITDNWYHYPDLTDRHVRTTIAYYYAMIDMIDIAVGQLLDTIEQAGEMDNTIFVFASDHGEFLGDYGVWKKGALHYENLIRVPCFISYPRQIAPARRVAGLTQMIDLAPTIHSLIGIDANPGHQGIDMSDALCGDGEIGRPWAYTESYRALWGPFKDCWTLRTPTAKLNFYPRDRVGHLIDLTNDPEERVDRFSDTNCRSLRDEMMANLIECVHSQYDPLPHVISQY